MLIMPLKIGVVGAGLMGHGIAEMCAIAGYEVTLSDITDDILRKALEKIKWSLQNLAKKGGLKEDPEKIVSRIRTSSNLKSLSDADYIIEAVKEDSNIKKELFGKLEAITDSNCVFATNTSTIPISELASSTKRADRFIGLHFFNPPALMPIVEIIRGDRTSDETLEKTRNLARSIGKDYVTVKKDVPGFLVNRLNDRVILESMSILEDGYRKEDLDSMVRFRLNFPMGMCELLDFVGIDTVFYAGQEMKKRGFDTRSSGILKKMVEAGKLGMKSGEGFYKYPKPNVYVRPNIMPSDGMYLVNPLRLISAAINEAAWLIRNDVASLEDIDKSMTLGMNWPEGPLKLADKFGIDVVVSVLEQRLIDSGETRFNVDPLLKEKVEKNELGKKSGKGFYSWKREHTDFGAVKYTKIQDYGLITLNRPEKLNSLNEEEWETFRLALEKARDDNEIRCVVVTGEGRAFCGGDDIDMMSKWKSAVDAKKWMEKYATPLIDLLANYPKPLISAVNGIAFGGGCELNLLFDIVLASEKAVFATPEGLIGAMPPLATSYGTALVSRKMARYALTGDWITAQEAKQIGFVDVVVPHEQLTIVTAEFVDKIRRISPMAAEGVKSAVNLVRQGFAGQAKFAAEELIRLASSEDFKEGQRAFLHKQKPEWIGK